MVASRTIRTQRTFGMLLVERVLGAQGMYEKYVSLAYVRKLYV